jgi:glycosyltransferase involved in cell wall biosynthesis
VALDRFRTPHNALRANFAPRTVFMKIIYFTLDYSPHDHRFLTTLSESDHQAFYVRLQRGPRQVESRPVPENVEIIQWAGGQKPFEWRDLPGLILDFRRVVRKIRPDLIHAGPIQTCAFIAVLSGFRPILTMSWGFDLMRDVYRGRWWEFATRYTLKRSAFFTSDAQVTRDAAIKYGMNPEKTVVFPWGVDLEHFRPRPAPRTPRGFTLFCNRAWEPIYGVDVLARAFVKVAAARPQLGLLLLGSGSQGHLIRDILSNGGVLEQVTFAGQINNADLPRFYQMADLYISASHVDGSSVSLMEALACGLPCLVSDIPANKEWVQEGYNGWLFSDNDHNELAAKILKAIEQREKLPEIGKNSRATAEAKADWQKNVQILLSAYAKTVHSN